MSTRFAPSTTTISLPMLGWLCALMMAGPGIAAAQNARMVVVTGLDYAFRAPNTLEAGSVLVSLLNQGTVRHEVVLIRLKQGRTLSEYLRASTIEERRTLVDGLIGLILAESGQTAPGRLLAELEKGRTYALICNLRDAPEKPQHFTLGMAASLHVK